MNTSTRPVESQQEAILHTLGAISKCHNKPYCWASQQTQLDLLLKYHHWNISRRTLNRRLRELEDQGYFERVRRHIKGNDGQLMLRSTLYKLKAKFFEWAYRAGQWAKRFFNVFAVPKWAQYQKEPLKVSPQIRPSEGFSLLLREKDGSVSRYYPSTGVINST